MTTTTKQGSLEPSSDFQEILNESATKKNKIQQYHHVNRINHLLNVFSSKQTIEEANGNEVLELLLEFGDIAMKMLPKTWIHVQVSTECLVEQFIEMYAKTGFPNEATRLVFDVNDLFTLTCGEGLTLTLNNHGYQSISRHIVMAIHTENIDELTSVKEFLENNKEITGINACIVRDKNSPQMIDLLREIVLKMEKIEYFSLRCCERKTSITEAHSQSANNLLVSLLQFTNIEYLGCYGYMLRMTLNLRQAIQNNTTLYCFHSDTFTLHEQNFVNYHTDFYNSHGKKEIRYAALAEVPRIIADATTFRHQYREYGNFKLSLVYDLLHESVGTWCECITNDDCGDMVHKEKNGLLDTTRTSKKQRIFY